MKKILIIIGYIGLVSGCASLVSCTYNQNQTNDCVTNEPIPWEQVTEFTYKGHDYIKFKETPDTYRGYAGVVHSPECKKCFDKFD